MSMLSDSIGQIAAAMIVAALIVMTLIAGQTVLIPLAGAIIISFMLSPVVRKAVRWGLPHALSVIGVVVLVLSLLISTSTLLSVELLSITSRMSDYQENFSAKVRTISAMGREDGAIKRTAEAITRLTESIGRELSGSSAGSPPADPAAKPVVVEHGERSSSKPAFNLLGELSEPVTRLALLVLFTVFLLLQHQDMRDRVVRIFGADNLSETTSAMSEAGKRLSRMFLAQAILSAGYGTLIGVVLWLAGLPGAMVWGLLAALMRFVPFIGAYIAAIPPIILAAGVDPGWWLAIGTAALFLVSDVVMGNVIEPLVLGKRVGLSPFAMIAAASFWTMVWGAVGLLLAAPLTMTVVVLGRYIPGLSFVTILLGDEPPLEPEQELYHRLLSADPLSAAEQIGDLMEETSPTRAADTLVLPALALAAHDARTNRLTETQLASLRETLFEAVELNPDLALPGEPHGEATIMIAGARGEIDVMAAEFLARVIGAETHQTASPITRATGLTALTAPSPSDGEPAPKSIIIASLSGLPKRHLQLMADRAARNYPGAKVLVLNPGTIDQIGPARSATTRETPASDARLLADVSELIGNLNLGRPEPAAETGPADDTAASVPAVEMHQNSA